MKLSACNRLSGTITEVLKGEAATKVTSGLETTTWFPSSPMRAPTS